MGPREPSILMVAGEPSGDLHGSKVVARLGELAPDLRVFGVGGESMARAGMEVIHHVGRFAVVGFAEILTHIPRLKRAMDDLTRLAREKEAGLAILIDYPGFNLMLAGRLQRLGVPVLYYISPQVWAWGEGRVRRIARRVERMAVVFSFEEAFYRERGVEVAFVGHPLLEVPELAAERTARKGPSGPPLLGLLPGSRRQEIARHLPVMLGAAELLAREFAGLSVKVGAADPAAVEGVMATCRTEGINAQVLPRDRTYELMATADALLVSSGTATLEAACFGTPMVVVYKMAPLSYVLARMVVRIPDIGLVNVVAKERVVPELIQRDATPKRLAGAVAAFLSDPRLAEHTSRALLAVRDKLGTPGASDRVARMALDMIRADR